MAMPPMNFSMVKKDDRTGGENHKPQHNFFQAG